MEENDLCIWFNGYRKKKWKEPSEISLCRFMEPVAIEKTIGREQSVYVG